jgi:hypothetical protein
MALTPTQGDKKTYITKLLMDVLLSQLNGNVEKLVKWIDDGMAVTWIKSVSYNDKQLLAV